MSSKPWLPLVDYSTKYDVSISTLRRRIKEQSIDFKLDNGKYFITDEPMDKKPRGRKPFDENHSFFHDGSEIGSAVYFDNEEVIPVQSSSNKEETSEMNYGLEMSEIKQQRANIVDDLKRAYTQVLHEKEDQILQLHEEIADLKTLVKVLESENERLRKKL